MDSIFNDDFPIYSIERYRFPGLLAQTPKLPDSLRVRGALPPRTHTYITVVGSRKYTDYGKKACETLIKGLAGLPVVIVSGLALGIDSIAHRAALDCGLLTLAVPGSGLDDGVLYPATHFGLAQQILKSGGALVSPFPDGTVAAPWTFPVRNGIMAGISRATLVIEAENASGTLITSNRATDLSRDVLALPGSIFSPTSDGPNQLIREGATPITCAADVIDALGLNQETIDGIAPTTGNALKEKKSHLSTLSANERRLLDLITTHPGSRDIIFTHFGGAIQDFNVLVSTLEIKGLISEFFGQLSVCL